MTKINSVLGKTSSKVHGEGWWRNAPAQGRGAAMPRGQRAPQLSVLASTALLLLRGTDCHFHRGDFTCYSMKKSSRRWQPDATEWMLWCSPAVGVGDRGRGEPERCSGD